MQYYHVRIFSNDSSFEQKNDLSRQDLLEKIVHPYEKGEGLFINGSNINAFEIKRIQIRETQELYGNLRNKFQLSENEGRERDADRGIIRIARSKANERAFTTGKDVLDEFISGAPGHTNPKPKIKGSTNSDTEMSSKIFIVHGRNEEMKQSVARFIERVGLEPIILHEQPNNGRTIMEKFSAYSDVSCAIALLSADDLGYSKESNSSNAKHRARQNVILELGYFLGKLGRNRVVAMYESGKDIEIPSDYDGVIYIGYSSDGNWRAAIAKELLASGIKRLCSIKCVIHSDVGVDSDPLTENYRQLL